MPPNELFEIPEPRSKKKIIGTLLFVILLLGVLAGGAYLWTLERKTSAPLRVSRAFMDSFLAGDVDQAYALTADRFRQATSKDGLKEATEKAKEGLDASSLNVKSGERQETEEYETATVLYEISGKDGEYELLVTLEAPKGTTDWKVSGVDNTRK
jgi:hypothetical protein